MSGSSDDALLAKTAELTMLFDCYGELLAEKQRTYLTLHLQEDWTLSEIAEEHGVSRQAVYDQVRRAEQLLAEYEAKLRLMQKHQQRLVAYEELSTSIEQWSTEQVISWLLRLRKWD